MQARANELARVINEKSVALASENINFDSLDLVAIKHKTSRSDFYKTNELYTRSQYTTYVLAEVADMALELQQIRCANQGNDDFDFLTCEYTKVIKRDADHANFWHEYGITFEVVRRGACLELFQKNQTMAEKKEEETLSNSWVDKDNLKGFEVSHRIFGKGIITNDVTDSQDTAIVKFSDGQVKYLSTEFLIKNGAI